MIYFWNLNLSQVYVKTAWRVNALSDQTFIIEWSGWGGGGNRRTISWGKSKPSRSQVIPLPLPQLKLEDNLKWKR